MFGYVTQKEFDLEREARIKADALLVAQSHRIADLLALAADWKDIYETAQRQLASERMAHTLEIKQLLDHLQPLAAVPAPGDVRQPYQEMTADEIMALPAASKREMHLRAIRANQARIREEAAKADKQLDRIRELQTPEEQRATMPDFDYTLGMFKETEVEKDAAHDTN